MDCEVTCFFLLIFRCSLLSILITNANGATFQSGKNETIEVFSIHCFPVSHKAKRFNHAGVLVVKKSFFFSLFFVLNDEKRFFFFLFLIATKAERGDISTVQQMWLLQLQHQNYTTHLFNCAKVANWNSLSYLSDVFPILTLTCDSIFPSIDCRWVRQTTTMNDKQFPFSVLCYYCWFFSFHLHSVYQFIVCMHWHCRLWLRIRLIIYDLNGKKWLNERNQKEKKNYSMKRKEKRCRLIAASIMILRE